MRRRLLYLLLAAFLLASPLFADTIIFQASLSGSQESPPNASPGTGSATVTLDTTAQTLHVQVSFSGLLGTTTASHIHCCVAPFGTVGVATTTPTFAGFPLGVTSGTYDRLLDLTDASSYNPSFITANGSTVAAAEAVLIAGMLAGHSYLNIHTNVVPGGEIRSFLVAPEPSSIALLASALLGGLALRRRRKIDDR